MKKIIFALIILIVAAVSAYLVFGREVLDYGEPQIQNGNNVQQEMISVQVYFSNSILNPGIMDCSKVYSVERKIVKTQAVGRAALEELLKGPSDQEKADGYFTGINEGVKIQKLNIVEGVAKVDFDEQLQFQVGGSCRIAEIISQITETLKQFPTVNEVIISIDGRTEDILQP